MSGSRVIVALAAALALSLGTVARAEDAPLASVEVRLYYVEATDEFLIDLGHCTTPRQPWRCRTSLTFQTMDLGGFGIPCKIAPFRDEVWMWWGKVSVTGNVLLFPETGDTFLAVAGQAVAVDFPEPEMRSEGYTREWTGTVQIEEPPRPAPSTVAAPTPTATPAQRHPRRRSPASPLRWSPLSRPRRP